MFVSNNYKENFSNVIGKAKIANIIGQQTILQFENHWSNNYELLELKLTSLAKMAVGKTYQYFIFVYDLNYTVRLSCY